MKKTLSLVLALALAVSMIASMALIVPSTATSTDPLLLTGIKVSDAAGYAAPYAAVDSAKAYYENEAAYVVISFEVKPDSDSDFGTLNTADTFKLTLTSSTLDLGYINSTSKLYSVENNVIMKETAPTAGSVAADKVTFDTTRAAFAFAQDTATSNGSSYKYYFSFIAVTKAATAGEVKAAMTVAATKYATGTSFKVYDATGLKYIVDYAAPANALGAGFKVSTWNGIATSAPKEVITYRNSTDGSKFGGLTYKTFLVTADYFSKLSYTDGDNKIDVTDAVNAINTFFGFSFANTDYPVLAKHFEDKTVGNPIVVTDTYAYVTAAVTDGDGDVDIAPTGDFSANIVIVMAASAVLAAAALAFVAKKVRD